jgi:hypothetical protein
MRVYATKHFASRMMDRQFDMSVIWELLEDATRNPDKSNFEVTTGNSTVIAVRKNNTLRLVTGWTGNRSNQ